MGKGKSGMSGPVPSSNGRHTVNIVGGSVTYTVDSDGIYIDNIKIDEDARQKGNGTKLLNRVKSISDDTGKPIELFASPTEGEMSTKQLVDWYKKHNFSIVKSYGSLGARMKYSPKEHK